ncbi:hypothetical protein GCM10023091_24300 [Ravibacter arvi]|uniref:Bulb-type lectin domain-containing protein n=1 Tax=Ravibacter arvi TaxID=2051041 RepID=A0ABP8M2E5_9BACT
MNPITLLLLLVGLGKNTELIPPKAPDPYPCVKLVKDINPNGDGLHFTTSFGTDFDLPFRSTIEFNGSMYFGAANGLTSGVQLWKTDGTEAGTVKVKTLYPPAKPGLPGRDANQNGFLIVGQTLYFVASNYTNGRELWKTDGTTAGTVLVKDIQPDNAVHDPPTF